MARSSDQLVAELGVAGASAQRKVAGVLYTYRCTIRCRHCCFGCTGNRPDKVMPPRQLADALALLHETGRIVHVAGGEAMLYWDILREGLAIAHAEGNAPYFIETNASFAADDATVEKRFLFLAAHGVCGVLASADPYHQEFVPPERFLRVRRIARRVFGDKGFWGSGASDEAIMALPAIAADEARLREHVRAHPPVMVGAAQRFLARFLDQFAPRDPALPRVTWRGRQPSAGCLPQFEREGMWELHLDPYGNIQTNCGIILGRWPQTTPAALLAAGPENANRFVRCACDSGGLGLAELAAAEYGFVMPERVSQACELCFLARCHLRRFHPEVFGPEEVYGR